MGKAPVVNDNYLKVIEDARKDIQRSLTQNNNNDAPIVLRTAFHDAVNYDAATNKGGANGSIRLSQELGRNPNKGIDNGVKFNESIKQRHPEITYADLYQLAAIVAVEVSGGPAIEFIPGRADTDVADQDNIPNPREGADHLRTVFYKTGLDDKDIVVLTGAHALGGAHKDRSGFDGNFTQNPLKFDNSYYVELLKGDTPGLVKFPTDKALLNDSSFRPFVELYAADQAAFFRDYAKSHKKLSELGFHAQEANVHEKKTYNAPRNANHAQCCAVGN